MDKKFWQYFSIGFFIVNTLTIIILMETIIFNRLYISLFILCFLITILLNKKT